MVNTRSGAMKGGLPAADSCAISDSEESDFDGQSDEVVFQKKKSRLLQVGGAVEVFLGEMRIKGMPQNPPVLRRPRWLLKSGNWSLCARAAVPNRNRLLRQNYVIILTGATH